jgi:hypothetical protein
LAAGGAVPVPAWPALWPRAGAVASIKAMVMAVILRIDKFPGECACGAGVKSKVSAGEAEGTGADPIENEFLQLLPVRGAFRLSW